MHVTTPLSDIPQAQVLHALMDPCTALTSFSLAMHAIERDHLPSHPLPNLTSLCLRDSTGTWLQQESSFETKTTSSAESQGSRGFLIESLPYAGLLSLVISSPGLRHGLPACWLDGGDAVSGWRLTRLVLHGSRVPWRHGQSNSGLCCLSRMPQVSARPLVT